MTWFHYDGSGNVYGMEYDGAFYTFRRNLQGDIVAVLDANGTAVASYTYNVWGKLLNVTGTMAETVGRENPFRYRGYYYDDETGFYYVSSRYYDPEIGRFINADTITDGGAGVLGNNLFMYAANNPVNNSDPSGHWIIKNAIKWIAKNVVKPVAKKVQKALSKVNATYSRGINVSGSPSAFSFNLRAGVSIDTKGNVAIQGNFSGGVTGGSPGASITAYQTVTNAPNITNVGFGTPGSEFHVEWGETATWNQTQFNVFDVAKGIYVKIMEW